MGDGGYFLPGRQRIALRADREWALVAAMRLRHGIHLGYCTNIHRGETWAETFDGLRRYTDGVRRRVCPDEPYGIGLRLGAQAAGELAADPSLRDEFRRWMDGRNAYVFTVNGFPYGKFHGTRVKEQVYAPDWTAPERLAYTNRLFDLVAELAPEGESVSVSTLPGSFKEFVDPHDDRPQREAMCRHLRACSDHIESIRDRTGRDVHLGLEPEPLGLFETSGETVAFFDQLRDGCGEVEAERLGRNLGVNYDTCHLAVEFEEPGDVLGRFRDAGVRVSKIHLSSALRLTPDPDALERLEAFDEEVYLHQVVVGAEEGDSSRFRDLPDALAWYRSGPGDVGEEWRVHFHVPLHAAPEPPFRDTRQHIRELLEALTEDPECCAHFEMETYTWEVLPEALRAPDVVDQLEAEYRWILEEFRRCGLA